MMILTSSSRFRPERLSTLQRFIDGSNPANGTLPANGASLASLTNKGRATITTTQATGASQATFVTNQYAGKGCVRVTSSTNYASTGLIYTGTWTKIMAVTPSSVASTYYEGSSFSSGRGPAFISGFTPSGTLLNFEYYNNLDRLTISQSATGLHILAVTIVDGGAINVYLDGTLINTKATASSTINGVTSQTLFCSTAGSGQGAYDMCALLDFNAVLGTTTDLRSVLHYLGDYFGVTVA